MEAKISLALLALVQTFEEPMWFECRGKLQGLQIPVPPMGGTANNRQAFFFLFMWFVVSSSESFQIRPVQKLRLCFPFS